MSANDIGVMLIALARNVLYLVIGIAVLIAVVEIVFMYMNKALGMNFKDHVWDKIKDDPKAISLYFSLRIFGVLLAGGLIASAFLK